jgi:hypothetical protein
MSSNEEEQALIQEKPSKAKQKSGSTHLHDWLARKEAEGPINDKLKDFFIRRAAGRTDFDAVWQELWR